MTEQEAFEKLKTKRDQYIKEIIENVQKEDVTKELDIALGRSMLMLYFTDLLIQRIEKKKVQSN